ncbi:hypothetical protein ABEB36_002179 [Hypothenemus hampei]|uniref:Uncharacterized protein n=1 Tax=Hypothenemus hampei TaxID=57062 RepID=A0ABD1F4U1_HYPHA
MSDNTYFIETQLVGRNRSRVGVDYSHSKVKSVTFKYYGNENGKRMEMCTTALCQILTMTRGEINRLCALQFLNKAPRDLRRFNPKVHAEQSEVQEKIMDLVLTLPQKDTHYGGKQCYLQLDFRLDIKILHQMFVKKL